MIKYDTLYKIDSVGNVRVWWMERDKDRYRIHHGVENGEIQITNWETAIGKNIGRSNMTTSEEQAEKEIKALYANQLSTGYTDTPSLLGQKLKNYFDPMLCSRWNDDVEKKLKERLEIGSYKFHSQPKLDGIRCIARKDGLWSRNGKRIKSCPHIEAELKPVFARAPNLVLDGELYNHEYKNDFNSLSSLIKKEKLSDAEILGIVQYHIYDAPGITGEFSVRFGALTKGFENKQSVYPSIRLVETHEFVKKYEGKNIHDIMENLDNVYEGYIQDGYEGQIIRLPGSLYEEGKRSKALIKRKPLYDGGNDIEETIIDIEDGKGNWQGIAKVAVLYWPLGKKDKITRATLKGNMEFLRKVWQNKDKYKGKLATVTYQNLTPDGYPRFPVIKELDRQF